MTKIPDRARSLGIAALRGVAAGAVVGMMTAAIAGPAYECRKEGYGCIGVAVVALVTVLAGALLLGWLGLKLVRADWPFGTAAAGTVTTLCVIAMAAQEAPTQTLLMMALAAAGYGISALVLCRPSSLWVRIEFVGVVAAIATYLFVIS